ncbi:hypothetical protein [Kitasatospora sp. NBC_01539]|uniref:hypothetical protein n=1 Tax=Kitasatospora sp. NBC_01539 TaxID=2903577 RepID=UPI003860289E
MRSRIPDEPSSGLVRHDRTIRLRSPWAARSTAPEVPAVSVVEHVLIESDGTARAVFVDQSGRRGRALRGLGWVAGLACAGFAGVALTTVAGSNGDAPSMPIPSPVVGAGKVPAAGASVAAPASRTPARPTTSPAASHSAAAGKPAAASAATSRAAAASGAAVVTRKPDPGTAVSASSPATATASSAASPPVTAPDPEPPAATPTLPADAVEANGSADTSGTSR